jgi:hypothetical protein
MTTHKKLLATLVCLATAPALQAMESVADDKAATGFELLRAASPEADKAASPEVGEGLWISRQTFNEVLFGCTGLAQKKLSAGARYASKQWDPESYVLNPENPQLYSQVIAKVEAAPDLEALAALLHDEELGGDVLKRISARATAGQSLLAQMTRDMLNGTLATDSAGLTKIGQIFEATAQAQKALTPFYCKFTELAIQKNKFAAAAAQRGADMLPK